MDKDKKLKLLLECHEATYYLFKLPNEFSESSINLMIKMLDNNPDARGSYDSVLNQ